VSIYFITNLKENTMPKYQPDVSTDTLPCEQRITGCFEHTLNEKTNVCACGGISTMVWIKIYTAPLFESMNAPKTAKLIPYSDFALVLLSNTL
jgi:hypothetical protein